LGRLVGPPRLFVAVEASETILDDSLRFAARARAAVAEMGAFLDRSWRPAAGTRREPRKTVVATDDPGGRPLYGAVTHRCS
jgi:hypothetical protein